MRDNRKTPPDIEHAAGAQHIESFDQTFLKVCDESRGEEPLVAHGLLANHCADARNPLSVQELAGLGDCDRGAHSKIASAQRIHLLAVSPMDL